ncbi:PREDICTED: gem-associated protein 5-like, partial [Priapulus caudatus]|uniref:Gem-associated protein 5-like n=1 Tax=Priapulus caudatus TaxID=37621 RepID=A0ABM1EZK3_PRICU
MKGIGLAISPSWYCSRVSACNSNGIVAYGGRNSVVFLNTRTDPPVYCGWICESRNRVTSVVWHPTDGSTLGCSGDEEGKVRVWDADTKIVVASHNHHGQNRLTVVDWSPAATDVIVSADDRGHVYSWNYASDEATHLHPEPQAVSALACSPHHPGIVAIGYKSGSIIVVDVEKKGSVVQKFKGHDEEIHSLAWSPSRCEDFRQTEDVAVVDSNRGDQGLLASGSKDRTIRLWSRSRGRSIAVMRLPNTTRQRGGGGAYDDSGGRSRTYVALLWPRDRPQELISSSHGGDLLLWDLSKPGKGKFQVFTTGGVTAHARTVFSIVQTSWDTICTISMDRQIILWDLQCLTSKVAIPTVGGTVNTIAISSQTGRLAIGAGDCQLRVWSPQSESNAYELQLFWQGIKAKVTAVAWHPSKEGWLAYATEEGRVGIYDVLASKPPMISASYHKGTIYTITWGRPCNLSGMWRHLLSRIFVIGFLSVTHKLPMRTDLAWKPDFSMVAVGNDDGSVQLFRPTALQLVCTLQVHRKLINCLCWHPQFTHASDEVAPLACWLASGSNESNVVVYDLTELIGTAETETEGAIVAARTITECYRQLAGHATRITSLAWSPHVPGRLASVSYDGTAQVSENRVHMSNDQVGDALCPVGRHGHVLVQELPARQ